MSDKPCIAGLVWHDITTYSRGDTDRSPHVWEAQGLPTVRLCVMDSHISYRGRWVASGYPFWDMPRELKATDRDDAMRKAVALLTEHVRRLATALSLVLEEPAHDA